MLFLYKGTLLSERFKVLYFIRIWQKKFLTLLTWYFFGTTKFASEIQSEKLKFRCIKHSSKLLRIHDDSCQKHITWQHNKIVNLKIAAKNINGVIIKPRETFSFCKIVGLSTKKKGYLEGMELYRGEARGGIGGGNMPAC